MTEGIFIKVAIIGSRSIHNVDESAILRHLPKSTDTIVSGGACGVDSFAQRFAKKHKLNFIKFEPDYAAFGRKAPILRNVQIVEAADLVLAVWDFKSRGTAHTIVQCIKTGVSVIIVDAHTH